MDKLLDVSAVAKKLNLSPNTIRTLLRDQRYPLRGTKLGKSIRIFSSSVDELIKIGEEEMLKQ